MVIALSKTEVAKLCHGDTRPEIGSEARKLRVANEVDGEIDANMLVMERLYPMDFRAYKH